MEFEAELRNNPDYKEDLRSLGLVICCSWVHFL